MHPIERWVKGFVEWRGYGPWYQREAWDAVKNVPIEGRNVLIWLDVTYPSVRSAA